MRFETWNAIFIGNALIQRKKHPEYKGLLPYVPLTNTLIPGTTMGRPEFYDIEQLIREKDERFSEAAQMMSRAINGQYWQLVGPESPDVVPPSLRPTPNQVVGPGAGNRIEAISPWMPTFQIEQHLARIDRELNDVSGLNDLLRGLGPTAGAVFGQGHQCSRRQLRSPYPHASVTSTTAGGVMSGDWCSPCGQPRSRTSPTSCSRRSGTTSAAHPDPA